MARPKGTKNVYFSSVKQAREAIREKAMELVEGYMSLIQTAQAAEEFQVAAEGYQFLMKHLPKDEEGNALLDAPIDKGATVKTGPTGPTIQIGIALGPQPAQKALPPVNVIDITSDE
jgi:hypothetical protein